jgi:hypothetical protein
VFSCRIRLVFIIRTGWVFTLRNCLLRSLSAIGGSREDLATLSYHQRECRQYDCNYIEPVHGTKSCGARRGCLGTALRLPRRYDLIEQREYSSMALVVVDMH